MSWMFPPTWPARPSNPLNPCCVWEHSPCFCEDERGLPRGAARAVGFMVLVSLWPWPRSWQLPEMKDALNDFILGL